MISEGDSLSEFHLYCMEIEDIWANMSLNELKYAICVKCAIIVDLP